MTSSANLADGMADSFPADLFILFCNHFYIYWGSFPSPKTFNLPDFVQRPPFVYRYVKTRNFLVAILLEKARC